MSDLSWIGPTKSSPSGTSRCGTILRCRIEEGWCYQGDVIVANGKRRCAISAFAAKNRRFRLQRITTVDRPRMPTKSFQSHQVRNNGQCV